MQILEQTTEIMEARTGYKPSRTSTEANLTVPSEANSNLAPEEHSNFQAPRLFEYNVRTTLAERFPLLTCFAISLGLLASALITEVECLKGSGYFWR